MASRRAGRKALCADLVRTEFKERQQMAQQTKHVDVLVIGGGTGGTSAACQAATLGAKVLVIEPTPWLGGMITSAGVSAFDGNKAAMASGFFRRLRDAIEANYGGPQNTFTGWISETCFEPHLGARLLGEYVAQSGAEVWHGAEFVSALVDGKRVLGAVVRHKGELLEIHARITVEATEYGDVLESAGVPYRLGRDAKSDTGEADAPEVHDLEVQDLTWCATLKKTLPRATSLPRPANYDPAEFDCSTAELATVRDENILNHKLHSWDSFLSYSILPNDKHLLNWPFHSNDSPDTIGVFGSPTDRARAFELAKQRTLRYVYYMQNDLGHPEWGLATDEYGTPDHLPTMPYMRESRRGRGVHLMLESDVVPGPGATRAPFRADSVAIGDYYLDHHHSKAHFPPGERLEENYPDNAPFQIPFGSLIPEEWDGLLFAEKCISVSHIVNGCSRLQPVVMLTGQAVGAIAALAVKHRIEPRQVAIAEVQSHLIGAGVALYPTLDVHNSHPAFGAIQRLSMRGVFFEDDSMHFQPDSVIQKTAGDRWITRWSEATGGKPDAGRSVWRDGMTKADLFVALDAIG